MSRSRHPLNRWPSEKEYHQMLARRKATPDPELMEPWTSDEEAKLHAEARHSPLWDWL